MNKAGMCNVFCRITRGLAKLSRDILGCDIKKKKKSENLYGSLGAKQSDLLDMHEANCNMVIWLFCAKT